MGVLEPAGGLKSHLLAVGADHLPGLRGIITTQGGDDVFKFGAANDFEQGPKQFALVERARDSQVVALFEERQKSGRGALAAAKIPAQHRRTTETSSHAVWADSSLS